MTPGRSSLDDVIDVYKAGLDRSLIVRSLKRTVEERLEALMQLQEFAQELRRAGRASSSSEASRRRSTARRG